MQGKPMESDLRINLSSDVKHKKCNSIRKNDWAIVEAMIGHFASKIPEVVLFSYNSLMGFHLKYAVQCWISNCKGIESVEIAKVGAKKIIHFVWGLPCEDRIKKQHFESWK